MPPLTTFPSPLPGLYVTACPTCAIIQELNELDLAGVPAYTPSMRHPQQALAPTQVVMVSGGSTYALPQPQPHVPVAYAVGAPQQQYGAVAQQQDIPVAYAVGQQPRRY